VKELTLDWAEGLHRWVRSQGDGQLSAAQEAGQRSALGRDEAKMSPTIRPLEVDLREVPVFFLCCCAVVMLLGNGDGFA
jgi:hypothetical protein